MVFSSIEFILCFLPIFFLMYGITPPKYRNITLLAGSLFFYGFGDPGHLILLMGSVFVNYRLGLWIGKSGKRGFRRALFVVAIIANIGLLVWAKMGADGGSMPLGISFYTFQMLAYLIDVYRGQVQREESLLCFANYVTMFPKLLMGPLVNYKEVQGALRKREFTAEDIQDGLKVFIMGLGFKVLLADRIGLLWHQVQVTGFESISTGLAWLAALAYSMKLYFDFHGYSLMAVGLGKMLGFELPVNFRTPYMARSVRDFYRRWHVTLGRWFCDYVYIPLGGNRKGITRTILNMLAVWVLTSLWHGSTGNFLIWGGVLWICIVLEYFLEKCGLGGRLKVLPHIYLWAVIPVTWMCFAITDLSQLQIYLGRMFGVIPGIHMRAGDWLKAIADYWYLFAASFVCCTPCVDKLYEKFRDKWWFLVLLALLLWVCVGQLQLNGQNTFMYFRF